MNRGLLQYLSFCRPRDSDEQQTDIDSNDQIHHDGDKKSFYRRDLGLNFLLTMHTRKSLSGKGLYFCCQQVILQLYIAEMARLFRL